MTSERLVNGGYKTAVFDEDRELSPEVARLQLKALDKEGIWIPDLEASQIIEKECGEKSL